MSGPIAHVGPRPSLSAPSLNAAAENYRLRKDGMTPERQVPNIDMDKVDPDVKAAAQGFEAMFLDYLYQTMRKTVPKSEWSMDSTATEIYQSMMDSENAQRAAKQGGVGLAEQIVAFLDRTRYNKMRDEPHIGGAHEGQSK